MSSDTRRHRVVGVARRPLLILWWLLVVVVVPRPAVGQVRIPSSAQLAGDVKDSTGAPLEGVTATLRGPNDRSASTRSDGHFFFEGLPDGDYTLKLARSGFATTTRTVHLTPGQAATVTVLMAVEFLEAVTITADRTGEQDVQATPLAVTVLPADELERLGAHTVADIGGLAPSVTFSQNSDFSQLTIRGIGSNTVFAGTDPSSAVYVDGVYIARPVGVVTEFLDLDRVEVLRGPQGTLYGRNAVGGALNLITRDPSSVFDVAARVATGDFGALRGEARVGGRLFSDNVTGTAAVLRGVRRGFVRDLDHTDHPLGGEDVTATRGKVRVAFDERTSLLVAADTSRQDPTPLTYAKVLAVKPGFQVDNPADLHEVRTSTPAASRNLQYGVSARLTSKLTPSLALSSLTAFRKLDYNVINDADITELDLTSVDLHEFQHQVSEEVTLSQEAGKLTWIGGLFLFSERDHQPTSIRLPAQGLGNILDPEVTADSAAGFGQATRTLTRRLSVNAGLRYSSERKTIDNSGSLYVLDQPDSVVAGSAYAYEDAISYRAWTPKVGVELRAGDGTLVYGSATRGFKSGGFNFSSKAAGLGYAPEWAWSYEGGLKARIAGGRTRVNLAVFHTDYTDLQVQTAIRPGVLDISNAAAATIDGVEAESVAQLASKWQAGGHLAWLQATYDRYVAVGTGGVTGDAAGHRLNNAPEWSGRAWLEWRSQLGAISTLSLRADSRWQSTVFFTPFNDTIQRQRPYGLLDISAEFRPHRSWAVSAYVRNLTNTDFITGTFSSPIPAIGGRPGYSRQAGIQLALER
jgi:iron complex outermembrane receptor protein